MVNFFSCSHVHRSGHIEEYVVTSEEAISKGVRRMVALTGPDALKVTSRSFQLLKGGKIFVYRPVCRRISKNALPESTDIYVYNESRSYTILFLYYMLGS